MCRSDVHDSPEENCDGVDVKRHCDAQATIASWNAGHKDRPAAAAAAAADFARARSAGFPGAPTLRRPAAAAAHHRTCKL